MQLVSKKNLRPYSDNQNVSYSKAEAEKTFLDMHQVHVITYNLNKAMNLYNLVATDVHSPFTPINNKSSITLSHGIGIEFDNYDLPIRVLSPFGAFEIENKFHPKDNQTLAKLINPFKKIS